MGMCDFYVKDRLTGRIHRVGDEQHDSIWVDLCGELHYMNLQTGDGCSGMTKTVSEETSSYEFVPSDCGYMNKED